MTAQTEFDEISLALTSKKNVSLGNLFGKTCIKLETKAFVAFYKDEMVFKLGVIEQKEIIGLKGAHLWDPSGAGRPMKEWTCLPVAHLKLWSALAEKSLGYAKTLTAKK